VDGGFVLGSASSHFKGGKRMKNILLVILSVTIFLIPAAGCSRTFKDTSSDSQNAAEKTSAVETKKENTVKAVESFSWKAKLYFPDKNAMSVVKEEREMKTEGIRPDAVSMARASIEELVKGPVNKELGNSMPKNTKILEVSLDKGLLTVDLSKEFEKEHPGGSTGTIMTLSQLVLTLTDIPGVDQVFFKVDGNILNDFKGHIEFKKPFKRADYEDNISK